MKKSLTLAVFLTLNYGAYCQKSSELIGEFSWSYSWYSSITLSLRDSGNFLLERDSDIGATRTYGTWTLQGSTLNLVPTKYMRATIKSKWQEGPVENNSHFRTIKVLSKDRLFTETAKSHIHLNRLPTVDDGPYKISFPANRFHIGDTPDTIALNKIVKRLSTWDHDYSYEIELSPQTSKKDAEVDPYIGLKRCREIMNYFVDKHGFGTSSFVIKDDDDFALDSDSEIDVLIIHKY